jgi:protein-tyrosine phosphatase
MIALTLIFLPSLSVSLFTLQVATSIETIRAHKISRIVNCSASVVPSYFASEPDLSYLNLHMVDGRQDDIGWFFCSVAQFVEEGRRLGQKTLIHCEKGISRSCSFAICYLIAYNGGHWRKSFDSVKAKRAVCAPNTAFTCNIIEITELLNLEARVHPVLFRLAEHLPHDRRTPLFKLCRDTNTRAKLLPSYELLDPSGVFLVAHGGSRREGVGSCGNSRGEDSLNDTSGIGSKATPLDNSSKNLFIWLGADVHNSIAQLAIPLAKQLMGLFSRADGHLEEVKEGEEPEAFREICPQEQISDLSLVDPQFMSPRARQFDDLYTFLSLTVGNDPTFVAADIATDRGSCADAPTAPQPGPALAPQLQQLEINEDSSTVAELRSSLTSPFPHLLPEIEIEAGSGDSADESSPGAIRDRACSVGATTSESGGSAGYQQEEPPAPAPASGYLGKAHLVNGNPVAADTLANEPTTPALDVSTTSSDPALQLPVDSMQAVHSPSIRARHPEYVDILRGPTPVEDLDSSVLSTDVSGDLSRAMSVDFPAGSSSTVEPDGSRSSLLSSGILQTTTSEHDERSNVELGISSSSKPVLYQPVMKQDTFIWQSMGVYDDDDLLDDACFYLDCQGTSQSFLWIGSCFVLPSLGTTSDPGFSPAGAIKWAESILKGEMSDSGWTSLKSIKKEVVLEGEEPEEWWEAFSEGF